MAAKPKPQSPERKPTGRPPMPYDQGVCDHICEQLVEGRSLRSICQEPDVPSIPTILKWAADERFPFAQQYARAMDLRADGYMERILEVAEGKDDPHDKRVKIDALKWVMGKQKPKKYGDRLDQTIEHVGADVTERLAAGRERLKLVNARTPA